MKILLFIKKAIRKVFSIVKGVLEEKKYQEISSKYNFHGYKRIYLIHIRKSGGTSLNNMFLSLSGQDPELLYNQLAIIPDHRLQSNGLSYVGWNVRYINKGNYFYAFSHTPLHKLDLAEQTFAFTCFRDPVKRVVSHYNMLMDLYVNKIYHPCMTVEGKWLGLDFEDFLQRIPQEHLLNQLYMFSKQFDVEEALLNVKKLSHYFFDDTFSEGINKLNRKTGLALEPIHIRKANYNASIKEESLAKLRNMLGKEYLFLDQLRKQKNHKTFFYSCRK